MYVYIGKMILKTNDAMSNRMSNYHYRRVTKLIKICLAMKSSTGPRLKHRRNRN